MMQTKTQIGALKNCQNARKELFRSQNFLGRTHETYVLDTVTAFWLCGEVGVLYGRKMFMQGGKVCCPSPPHKANLEAYVNPLQSLSLPTYSSFLCLYPCLAKSTQAARRVRVPTASPYQRRGQHGEKQNLIFTQTTGSSA